MVAISTILLVANLFALIFNGQPFMSFWFNLLAYVVELTIYFVILILFTLITTK